LFYLVLVGTFGLGLALLWGEPKWSLFGIFAAALVAMPIAMVGLLGGFSEQSLVTLIDVATFAALPALFLLIAPWVTLFRGMHLRAKRRRDEEELAVELAQFREDAR
jgi:hypothetical protein